MTEAELNKHRLALYRVSTYNAITRFPAGASLEQVYDFLGKAWTHRKVDLARSDIESAAKWLMAEEHIIEMNGGALKHVHNYIMTVDRETHEATPRRAA